MTYLKNFNLGKLDIIVALFLHLKKEQMSTVHTFLFARTSKFGGQAFRMCPCLQGPGSTNTQIFSRMLSKTIPEGKTQPYTAMVNKLG